MKFFGERIYHAGGQQADMTTMPLDAHSEIYVIEPNPERLKDFQVTGPEIQRPLWYRYRKDAVRYVTSHCWQYTPAPLLLKNADGHVLKLYLPDGTVTIFEPSAKLPYRSQPVPELAVAAME